jgi:hypothetical protein
LHDPDDRCLPNRDLFERRADRGVPAETIHQHQDDETTDDPCDGDRGRFQEVLVHRFVEEKADDAEGQERDEQSDEHPPAGVAAPDDAEQNVGDPLPVEDQDGQDGAELDDDGVRIDRRLRRLRRAEVEELARDDEMAGGTDREVLRDALHETEGHCVECAQLLWFLLDLPGNGPTRRR